MKQTFNTTPVYWQAHRGGGAHERPDNTMIAMRYTWDLGGIPEADIRSTADGVIICLHDKTLARTTDAPKDIANQPVNQLSLSEIQKWDAGKKFAPAYADERVPTLEEVFSAMSQAPSRWVYLDLKQLDLNQLGDLIEQYKLAEQILIASPKQEECAMLRKRLPGVRTMLWITGKPNEIEAKFDRALESGFDGMDQVQIHLFDLEGGAIEGWRYQVDQNFLNRAISQTAEHGIDLEVFPFHFEQSDILSLLNMGITWYATDEPARFAQVVEAWRMSKCQGHRQQDQQNICHID